MNSEPKPVGWETEAEWELEMRCANLTENTPFDEVSKLINDLWQQYCLAAEPKGVDRQVQHSNPVASQNTQILEDKATEGGAHEKALREALTPSAETKAAYMGEFSVSLPDWDEDGNEIMRRINVPWTTIKEIMAAISSRAALTAKQTDGRGE